MNGRGPSGVREAPHREGPRSTKKPAASPWPGSGRLLGPNRTPLHASGTANADGHLPRARSAGPWLPRALDAPCGPPAGHRAYAPAPHREGPRSISGLLRRSVAPASPRRRLWVPGRPPRLRMVTTTHVTRRPTHVGRSSVRGDTLEPGAAPAPCVPRRAPAELESRSYERTGADPAAVSMLQKGLPRTRLEGFGASRAPGRSSCDDDRGCGLAGA